MIVTLTLNPAIDKNTSIEQLVPEKKLRCLRAYLVARHMLECHYQNDVKWLSKANAYLNLAKKYYQQLAH